MKEEESNLLMLTQPAVRSALRNSDPPPKMSHLLRDFNKGINTLRRRDQFTVTQQLGVTLTGLKVLYIWGDLKVTFSKNGDAHERKEALKAISLTF